MNIDSLPTQATSTSRDTLSVRWLTRPAVVLGAMVSISALVRTLVAWQHQTPRYFPDEYIYASLGRSLAHGHYEIRGHLAHFPAIVEPLLSAPLWRFFSTETAYQLVQAQNAIALSLTAIPIYALARWLGLGRGFSYLSAAYGLVIPVLALAAVNVSDLIAYPLVLTALATGVRALDTPSPRRQVAFLSFAILATLARTQYFILVPAYILAAILLERRRMFRQHKVAALALIPIAILIAIAVLGFYSGVRSTTHLNLAFFKWLLLQSFLLTLEAGVAIVPGALIALFRPAERRAVVFSLFAGAFMVLLFCESAVYAANSDHFKERYLFSAMPLVPLAYGLYLKRGRPHRYAVVAVVAIIAVAIARLPVSAYAISTLRTDSEFLYGVSWFELKTSYGGTAFALAIAATAGGAYAIWTAFKGDRALAVVAAMLVAVVATVGAVRIDLRYTRSAHALLPSNLSWIDKATTKPVTVVATPYSSRALLFFALYWNPSITREVALDSAVPSDSFPTPDLRIGHDGSLLNAPGNLAFDVTVTSASFWNASVLAQAAGVTLWRPDGVPRLRTLVVGRYQDDWLNEASRVRAWPENSHEKRSGIAIAFTLSLPSDWPKTAHMKFGERSFVLAPGSRRGVVCWNPTGPVDLLATSRDVLLDANNRALTVQLTNVRTTTIPAGATVRGCAPSSLSRQGAKAPKASAAAPVPPRAPRPVL